VSRDDAKPPRIARDEHDRERMETWLNKKLNEALDIADKQFAEDVKHFNKAAKDAAFRQSLRARQRDRRRGGRLAGDLMRSTPPPWRPTPRSWPRWTRRCA
jgi:hypothetical protein